MVVKAPSQPGAVDGRGGGVPSRVRSAAAVGLGALCCLCLLASIVGVWARQTLLDTDAWVEQVAPLAEDEAVLEPLARLLTDQILTVAELERRLTDLFPDELDAVARPLVEGARTYVRGLVDEVLHSERFRTAWVDLNRVSHRELVGLLDNTGRVLESGQPGVVSVNLLPVVNWVLQQLAEGAYAMVTRSIPLPDVDMSELPEVTRERLSEWLGRPIPEDFGRIVVYRGDQLTVVQDAVLLFRKVVAGLVVATVVHAVGAVFLARRRAVAVLLLGVGVAASVVVGRIGVSALQARMLDLLASADAREAAGAILGRVVNGFADLTDIVLVAGVGLLVIGAVAALVGRAPRGSAAASGHAI